MEGCHPVQVSCAMRKVAEETDTAAHSPAQSSPAQSSPTHSSDTASSDKGNQLASSPRAARSV